MTLNSVALWIGIVSGIAGLISAAAALTQLWLSVEDRKKRASIAKDRPLDSTLFAAKIRPKQKPPVLLEVGNNLAKNTLFMCFIATCFFFLVLVVSNHLSNHFSDKSWAKDFPHELILKGVPPGLSKTDFAQGEFLMMTDQGWKSCKLLNSLESLDVHGIEETRFNTTNGLEYYATPDHAVNITV